MADSPTLVLGVCTTAGELQWALNTARTTKLTCRVYVDPKTLADFPQLRDRPDVVAASDHATAYAHAAVSGGEDVLAIHCTGAELYEPVVIEHAAVMRSRGLPSLRYRCATDTMFRGVVVRRGDFRDVVHSCSSAAGQQAIMRLCANRADGFLPGTSGWRAWASDVDTRAAYLVLGTPRTGSSHLSDILCHAQGYAYPREYFIPAVAQYYFLRFGLADVSDYIDHLHRHESEAGLLGVKGHWHHLAVVAGQLAAGHHDYPFAKPAVVPADPTGPEVDAVSLTLSTLLPNLRVVLTTRRDKVAQAYSALVATRRDEWYSYANSRGNSDLVEEGDVAEVRRLCAIHQSWEQSLLSVIRRIGAPCLTIAMEDLVDHQAEQLSLISHFLGQPPIEHPETRLVRQSDGARAGRLASLRRQLEVA